MRLLFLPDFFQSTRQHVKADRPWLVLPCLISAMSFLLASHYLSAVESKSFPSSRLSVLSEANSYQGPIQISLYPTDEVMHLKVGDLVLPYDPNDPEQGSLQELLKEAIAKIALRQTLSGSLDPSSTFFAINVDERVPFGSVRPLLRVMAGLGITDYGFNVKQPAQKQYADQSDEKRRF
jgi:hypothetical protein